MTRLRAAALGALLGAAPATGLAALPVAATGPLRLELPLLDVPYDVAHGDRVPSWAQATAIARDLHTGTSWAVDLAFERGCAGGACGSPARRWALEWAALLGLTALEDRLPLFLVWSHEEYHRVVLGQHGIDSHDDAWNVRLDTSSIYVSGVPDAALVALKRDHPADLARLSAAGMEGDLELARAIEADDFLDGTDWKRDLVTVAWIRASVVRYMWICDSSAATRTTDSDDLREPDPLRRDIVGYDCDAWAYDVQRPDEPYEARGPHPTGVGIDRYRRPTDLTSKERGLLVEAKWLSLLDLVDPAMLGIHWGVPLAPPEWRMTGGLAHQMTSFGQAVTLDLSARGGGARWRAAARLYLSDHLWLPGLELARVRAERVVGGARLEVTPSLGVWLQPAHDRWDDTSARPGAVARLRVAWLPSDRVSGFAEVLAKTAGWVAGTPALGPGLEGRIGVGGVL
jgi:hypothetical protein